MKQGTSILAALEHLVFIPTSREKKFPAVIALHGRGADERDLVPVVLALEIPNLLVISPRAPFVFPFGGYAWYGLEQEGVPEPATMRTSLGLLRKFVEEVKAGYPVDTERVILLGFSQGTVMAYGTALVDPPKFRGVIALSGYIPVKSDLHLRLDELSDFPEFISHGSNDPLIPPRFGREAAKILMEARAKVTYDEYPMGHEISEETVQDLKEWVRNVLRA